MSALSSTTVEQAERAAEVGRTIQAYVASVPSLAVSPVGIGLDALSTMLIDNPAGLDDLIPWIDAINAIVRYVRDGIGSPGAILFGVSE